ncbi:hypothetical protein BKA69DRAFT_280991 [Paraphysoderma sedebokerense]|nr:hypothetical protein BKA69DRAFT_280991 [Paraphysoderma sedebokerense]
MTPGTIPTMLQNSSTTFNGNVQQYGTNGQYYTMQHNQANQGMPIGTPNNGYLMTQGYGQTNMNMYAGTNQQQYYANDGIQMTDQSQNQAQTQKIWAPDQTYVQMFQRAQQVANPNAQAYPYANTGGFQSSQYPYGNTNY